MVLVKIPPFLVKLHKLIAIETWSRYKGLLCLVTHYLYPYRDGCTTVRPERVICWVVSLGGIACGDSWGR